ncbi:hypothetical protein LGT39_02835 [Demequina sp. TTPB684]|nr:hypothetical protein [Demequina sp. TTPB684]MCB2411784.1 hypothetical protein [Demequina sp. TTPB684]
MNWLPDDYGLSIAERDARWAAMFTADSPTWAALVAGDAWPDAEASEEITPDVGPSTSIISNVWEPTAGSSSAFETRFAFAELAADTSTDDNPLFVPDDVPPGATVEYESLVGSWHADYRFQIRSSLSSSSEAVWSQARTMWKMGGGFVGAMAYPGAGWREWNALASTGQDSDHIVETWSSVITAMPVFVAHLTGTHDTHFGALHRLFATAAIPNFPPTAARRYTPPRYRITYPDDLAGYWTTRQRQTAGGNAGGWPLRQRRNGGHSGSWPLRQRQTGL